MQRQARRIGSLAVLLLALIPAFQGARTGSTDTGTWSLTDALNTARHDHTATLLLDGRVLVVAGLTDSDYGAPPLSSCELYDPANGHWTLTGALGTARVHHTATLLAPVHFDSFRCVMPVRDK